MDSYKSCQVGDGGRVAKACSLRLRSALRKAGIDVGATAHWEIAYWRRWPQ